MISIYLEAFLPLHTRCDVVLDYSEALNYESLDILISIVEAKKTLTLDYGLSICEESIHAISFNHAPKSNDEKKIVINGVEIPIKETITTEDLVKLIIDIYEYSINSIEEYSLPVKIDNDNVFGSAALATP
ncbi:MAG: hypothetical protein LM585_00920 [Fervidicoccaceae archaeon]|nr:hypothetical protein [Fervidicoccaceae archaeon]MCC6051786.1 hypothetical protein [Fervidicoccaceae archaeon]